MNKRSIVLILMLSIIGVTLIAGTIYVAYQFKRNAFSAKVGEIQLEILDKVKDANKHIAFARLSGRYSALLALDELEEKAGLESASCGTENYRLWQSKDAECFPIQDTLYLGLSRMAPLYMDSYIGQDKEYEFYFEPVDDKLRVVGTAISDLNETIFFKGDPIGEYAIKPSFDILLNYDIGFYDDVIHAFTSPEGILNNVSICELNQDLDTCLQEAIKKYSFLEIDCENKDTKADRTYLFCAKGKPKYILPKQSLTKKQQKIKFAIYFRQNPSQLDPNLAALNPQGTEKKIILKWKKLDDADSYKLSFDSTDINIDKSSPETLNFKPEECVPKGTECRLQIKESTLYEDTTHFYYLIPNLENKEYTFKLTVEKGQEKEDFETTAKVMDRLAPKINYVGATYVPNQDTILIDLQNTVSNNIDGSTNKDLDKFVIFYSKSGCNDVNILDFYKGEAISTDTKFMIPAPQAGEHCIAVLAVDKNNNPVEVKQQGIDKEITVKPEYKDIIEDLAQPQTLTIS